MEVSIIKRLNYLPKVFMTENNVKFSVTDDFINCARYSSRSGATQEGCGIWSGEFKEVRGIFYVPGNSYAHISFRRKEISDENDVIKILKDFPRPLGLPLLVNWDNYSIYLYDEFVKGKKYGFPVAGNQGHLTISYIPPIKQAYKITVNEDKEVVELDRSKFEETNEIGIYNHTAKFDVNVLRFTGLHRFGGDGEIVYIPESTKVKVESSDHQPIEFSVSRNLWLLFSHPKPRKNNQD